MRLRFAADWRERTGEESKSRSVCHLVVAARRVQTRRIRRNQNREAPLPTEMSQRKPSVSGEGSIRSQSRIRGEKWQLESRNRCHGGPTVFLISIQTNDNASKGDVPKCHRRILGQGPVGIAALDRSCRRGNADLTIEQGPRKCLGDIESSVVV